MYLFFHICLICYQCYNIVYVWENDIKTKTAQSLITKKILEDVEIINVQGTHHDLFDQNYIKTTAKSIKDIYLG